MFVSQLLVLPSPKPSQPACIVGIDIKINIFSSSLSRAALAGCVQSEINFNFSVLSGHAINYGNGFRFLHRNIL